MMLRTLAAILVCTIECFAQKSLDVSAIDSYLTPYVRSNNFAGDVLIEQHGRVIFEKAYGFANREKEVRNARTTQFHIASVSMQFTAAAVLRLVDKEAVRAGGYLRHAEFGERQR
jgi:CubicO group peptidase (beta-lactamase class C family)